MWFYFTVLQPPWSVAVRWNQHWLAPGAAEEPPVVPAQGRWCKGIGVPILGDPHLCGVSLVLKSP